MPTDRYLFTSESVTEGHPDKMADQISDAVLDAMLEQDPNSRVACETLITTGLVIVAGEVTTAGYIDIPAVVRETIQSIGYTRAKFGFDSEVSGVLTAIQEQSSDIAMGVDVGGAGDQGMMFGYAIGETPELMPMPIMLAHKMARRLAEVRRLGEVDYLRPDGKTQVTVVYEDARPVHLSKVVVAAHHRPDVDHERIRQDMIERVVEKICPAEMMDKATEVLVNPTGSFERGGPLADTGLTGRKIIVDTYGGVARHGGGCFSGKDATKVDRSASYMMRYVAKNIVAAGLAERVETQVAYAIGRADPMGFWVDTFGTGEIADERLAEICLEAFDLRPRAIIDKLQLREPQFRQVAAYGHFGRTDLPVLWERTDMADKLRRAAEG
ncbi:MAG: methionine adenosyltransferase [Armatimonadota bacterium]|nr:MAG: methionine adenosyltransferase [Armatimonadota bacterium]